MDFKSKIEAAQKDLENTKSDIAELMGMAEAEERDLSDVETEQLQEMSQNAERLVKRIADLENAEKALGLTVVRKQGGAPTGTPPRGPAIVKATGMPDRPKGDLIFKSAVVNFLAHVQGKAHEEILRERYPGDPQLEAVVKSAVNPAMTDVAGWAQELTDDAIRGFQDLLRGSSSAAECFNRAGIQLSFDGLTAIKIPNRAGGKTDLSASWTGEGDAIPVKRGTFGQMTIYPYKWGVISTFSRELAMRSTPQIESLLRQFIIDDTATQLDANFWDSQAAIAGVRPAGVLEGVAGTASAGSTADNMVTDLRNLLDPILALDMGANLLILMHPSIALAMSSILTATGTYLFRDELSNGRLYGIPVFQTTNLPTDEMYCIDCAELAVAQGAAAFEVSDSATIVEVDDDGVPPTMTPDTHPRAPDSGQVGDAARDTVNNPPIRSLYQTYSVAIRMVQFLSWHRMRAGMVNKIHTIAY